MKDIIIRGRDIDLPLIDHIGVISNLKAEQLHWHKHGGYELLFVLDGATAYEFQGRPDIHISGGLMLIVPPAIRHRGAGDVRSPSSIFGIECNPLSSRASRLTPFTTKYLASMGAVLQNSELSPRPFGRSLRSSVEKLSRVTKEYADGEHDFRKQAMMRSLSCTILAESMESLASSRNRGPQEIINAATRFLESRFSEPLKNDDLVKHLGFSRARVFELFKEHTGMTPNDYLLRYRIRKAQEMLTDSKQPVTDIALSVGFSSSQYFSQVFLKYTGKTPSQYRNGIR